MRKLNVEIGQRFGSLVVLKELKTSNRNIKCKCDCGKIIKPRISKLHKGQKSCGCMTVHKGPRTHGMAGTPLFKVWCDIRQRCNNPNIKAYKHYGARGITVCKRWDKFENFLADMGPSYRKGLSIDRIDNDGNYGPKNCRWATASQQGRNRRAAGEIKEVGITLTASGKYLARVWILDTHVNVGRFDTIPEAVKARKAFIAELIRTKDPRYMAALAA